MADSKINVNQIMCLSMLIPNTEISCPCMISEGENTSRCKPKAQHKLYLVALKYPSQPKRTSPISKVIETNKIVQV